MITFIKKYDISFAKIPFKRNQDTVYFSEQEKDCKFVVSVVDGWNNQKYLEGDVPGRAVAQFVADKFPKTFLRKKEKVLELRVNNACKAMDNKVLKLYPTHASCVGVFMFGFANYELIVTVGSVVVLLWDGKKWVRPKEIGDYSLDPKVYPSDVSRFFGLGELKKLDPKLYKCQADILITGNATPIFLASDGFEDVFDPKSFNNFTYSLKNESSKYFVKNLTKVIQQSGKQKDDIAILTKNNLS
ncbi:hypothetical protein A3C98_04010 [Candidatus Roizmanbacteria bacterium RIFCSPHIGHO2_02_FULL_37_15]|uniref:PPM-type phosphatase domain-containing protein n=1 Tax=Candidatus Roizmanbacteria bacterium RIFCSPLOWO2_01_FULL_37_16 TaxID=1802058 RepID=A0A1F7IMJ0_9BACT|nr:MAG: hypothetical protein A2859_04250 [Candidatus Roizmanbacteria bacterium RIFCSPHIGHO2_01_FULL_37_16b]OGK22488.1 MAG: hypothetical protein A3C98_04010 [Candidatus Roizmanbacteria bacterium RIFCSPHIGHO2_02_FULL_37_15]OGK33547.1 MAG: hypothetical protein A3F57_05585 [Candidatus Roizmanbacteria bacterium RIFCSPHIGHO2_12_FULL_36_11]OGK44584.1 MAG: hypothetical protein A3B40_05370 [Candidatus Roizmanbacteria bacterium RIFCSPLOWO2_01_FULL_37_16]